MSIAVLIHSVLFIIFWMTNLTFKEEVNSFLTDTTGHEMDYLLILLLISLLSAVICSGLLFLKRKKYALSTAWILRILGVLYIIFFYGSFIVLFMKNPVQVARLGQIYQYFRLFPDSLLLAIIAWCLRKFLVKIRLRWLKACLISLFFILWIVPTMVPPGEVYRTKIPNKPRLIAHRGASQTAPENTMAAMNKAGSLGVFGLETDINISLDGVLFLLHDTTLERTTNISRIYPGQEKTPAHQFTWDQIAQLDAGGWFKGSKSFSGEKIPTFSEFLQVVKKGSLHLIFDLRIPPSDHPFYDETFVYCLRQIEATGVSEQTWILATDAEFPLILSITPQAILAKGVDYRQPPLPQELVNLGYEVVNSEFGLSNRMISEYRDAGLWVNLWTVDEPWEFSRLWLAGADSVTSNNLESMISLENPILAIRYSIYLVIWGLAGIVCAYFITLIDKK